MLLCFLDPIESAEIATLESQGHDCVVGNRENAEELQAQIRAAEVLIVRSTQVTRTIMTSASQLGLIIRAGAGTDNIDVDAASELGIYVCNVPGQNAVAVAELTLGLILALDRDLAESTKDLRASHWNKAKYSKASGLKGRNIAIFGFGSIGQEVATRATAFGMKLHALRGSRRGAETIKQLGHLGVTLHETTEELLAVADIVTLHLPLTSETEHMVTEEFLGQMKSGATLINTARGRLLDEDAVCKAMLNNDLRVGLDVYQDEPSESSGQWQTKFAHMGNFVGSHHIGASTDQARTAVAQGVVSTVKGYEVGLPPNCVNIAVQALGECAIAVRHRNEVGVLASILTCLGTAGLNVQQMRNEILEGTTDAAAVATIRISQQLLPRTVNELEAIPSVMKVDVLASTQPER